MGNFVLPSTFFLTLLLMTGLFFFIRASVKDRTEEIKLVADLENDLLLDRLKSYFLERSYRVSDVDRDRQQMTFQGFVRPSWFLAIFLSFLAALGLLCLSLVLAFLYPSLTAIFLLLILLAPMAGFFYWQKAGRLETVRLRVETLSTEENGEKKLQNTIAIAAHRDELTQLQQTLPLKLAN